MRLKPLLGATAALAVLLCGCGATVPPTPTVPSPTPSPLVTPPGPAIHLDIGTIESWYGMKLNDHYLCETALRDADASPEWEYLVPARIWGDALGLGVSWDNKTKRVYIGGKSPPSAVVMQKNCFVSLKSLMSMARLSGLSVDDHEQEINVSR